MSSVSSDFIVHRNGRPARAADLAPLAFGGYAHFTAMQVRGGRVRGLDLHLRRLATASETLFGHAVPDETVRAHLRAALEGGSQDLSLTVTMYAPAGEFTAAVAAAEPEMLVRSGPPARGPAGPLRLAAIDHERFMPAIKHVGEPAKTYLLRLAAEEGCDDVALIDRHGRLAEASIWNLAFWDGEAVVWPRAEILTGTTMQVLCRQLQRKGHPQRVADITPADLPRFAGAVVMNSWTPGVAVCRIGAHTLPVAAEFLTLLHRAYEDEPPVAP